MKKINLALVFSVEGANPNGDPGAENYPRINSLGQSVITDVCLKHKVRLRLMEKGESILIHGEDGKSMDDRMKEKNVASLNDCLKSFLDARLFGVTSAMKSKNFNTRGAISFRDIKSINIVEPYVEEVDITKCCNLETKKKADSEENVKGSDTMGGKFYRVPYALYVAHITVNPFILEKNGGTEDDVAKLTEALLHIFDNDESCARPAGSMNVEHLYYWEQEVPKVSDNSIQKSVQITVTSDDCRSLNDFKIEIADCGVPYIDLK